MWAVGRKGGKIGYGTYRPYMPEQGLLLPELLSEWLPEDHLPYSSSAMRSMRWIWSVFTLDMKGMGAAASPLILG